MNDEVRLVLERIRDYCVKIEDARAEYFPTRSKFDENEFFRDGCAFYVQQIGELAHELPQAFAETDTVPWFKVRGMRNVIAHAYDSVQPDLLWRTLKDDVPELKAHCDELLGT